MSGVRAHDTEEGENHLTLVACRDAGAGRDTIDPACSEQSMFYASNPSPPPPRYILCLARNICARVCVGGGRGSLSVSISAHSHARTRD